jgi:protein-tyrosine-phosphatase
MPETDTTGKIDILFIDWGNICRTSMVKALFRLLRPDWNVVTAGAYAKPGLAADPTAIQAIKALNASPEVEATIESHLSQRVSQKLVEDAKLVVMLGPAELNHMKEHFGEEHEPKMHLISDFYSETTAALLNRYGFGLSMGVPDPHGGDLNIFKIARNIIAEYLNTIIAVVESQRLRHPTIPDIDVLLVDEGNTCRTPMAEAILKELCPDWVIESAGTKASFNWPPALEAVNAVQTMRGMNKAGNLITEKRSQRLTEDLLTRSKCVVALSPSNLAYMQKYFKNHARKIRLLSDFQIETFGNFHKNTLPDVPDPFGRDREFYQLTRYLIFQHLKVAIPLLEKELTLSSRKAAATKLDDYSKEDSFCLPATRYHSASLRPAR